jgi:hypothetical protein
MSRFAKCFVGFFDYCFCVEERMVSVESRDYVNFSELTDKEKSTWLNSRPFDMGELQGHSRSLTWDGFNASWIKQKLVRPRNPKQI